jgi:hypothetical protein
MDNSNNPKLIKNGGDGTIVGNALRFLVEQGKTVSPAILEIAGSITGVKQLDTLADAIRGDKEMSETDKKLLLSNIEFDIAEMKESTERLRIDSEHSITRLVRPVTYMFFSIVFFSLVFFDGNIGDFTVNKAYVPVIETIFSTMTVFYFSSRGFEKIAKTWKEK